MNRVNYHLPEFSTFSHSLITYSGYTLDIPSLYLAYSFRISSIYLPYSLYVPTFFLPSSYLLPTFFLPSILYILNGQFLTKLSVINPRQL